MIEQDKKIKKAMPAKREPECFELQHAIIIPKGTILRQHPSFQGFSAPTAGGAFSVLLGDAMDRPDTYKRVIAG